MVARLSNWNSPMLLDIYLHRLADYIKDTLIAYEILQILDGATELTTRVDLRSGDSRSDTGYPIRGGHSGGGFDTKLR